jgi:hypothetical protein
MILEFCLWWWISRTTVFTNAFLENFTKKYCIEKIKYLSGNFWVQQFLLYYFIMI